MAEQGFLIKCPPNSCEWERSGDDADLRFCRVCGTADSDVYRYWKLSDPAVDVTYRYPGLRTPVEAIYHRGIAPEWFPTSWRDIDQLRQDRESWGVDLVEVTEPGGVEIS